MFLCPPFSRSGKDTSLDYSNGSLVKHLWKVDLKNLKTTDSDLDISKIHASDVEDRYVIAKGRGNRKMFVMSKNYIILYFFWIRSTLQREVGKSKSGRQMTFADLPKVTLMRHMINKKVLWPKVSDWHLWNLHLWLGPLLLRLLLHYTRIIVVQYHNIVFTLADWQW